MRFWLSLVNVPEVDHYVEIARFAEEVGFHGITIADHLVMPMKYESEYLYTPDGKTWWPDDLRARRGRRAARRGHRRAR